MPDFKAEISVRLSELQLSPAREAEIVEELSQHLEQEYERAVNSGASEEEGRKKALEELNTADLLRRELKMSSIASRKTQSLRGHHRRSTYFPISARMFVTPCAFL